MAKRRRSIKVGHANLSTRWIYQAAIILNTMSCLMQEEPGTESDECARLKAEVARLAAVAEEATKKAEEEARQRAVLSRKQRAAAQQKKFDDMQIECDRKVAEEKARADKEV